MKLDPKKLKNFAKGGFKKSAKKKVEDHDDDKFGEDDDKDDADESEDSDDDKDGKEKDHDDDDDDGEEDDHDDDVDVDDIADKVKSGKGDKRIMKLAKKLPKDHSAPKWADEDKWDDAKDKVGDPEEAGHGKHHGAVVAHVYKAMGGGIK